MPPNFDSTTDNGLTIWRTLLKMNGSFLVTYEAASSSRQIDKHASEVSYGYGQRPPLDHVINKIPPGKSANLHRKSALGLQIVRARLPPYLPHVHTSLPPEKGISGEEICSGNACPNWDHPEKWNAGFHGVI